MGNLVTIISLMVLSSTVFAVECNEALARESAIKYLNNDQNIFITAIEVPTYKMNDNQVLENLKVKFVKLKETVEIGELEITPDTCEVVKNTIQSAHSGKKQIIDR